METSRERETVRGSKKKRERLRCRGNDRENKTERHVKLYNINQDEVKADNEEIAPKEVIKVIGSCRTG
jgi:hypothetical protein